MGKIFKGTMGLCIVLSAGSALGSILLDPLWVYSDSGIAIYSDFQYCDTSREGNWLCRAKQSDQIPDTGNLYNGSQYINLDYTFTNDSLIIRNEFEPSIIEYSDLRPGFAGFKTAWDIGMVGFNLSRYKYLIFAHKGPTANQKVRIRCWYNNGECGAESFNEYLGTFTGSETWKVDTIIIPDAVQNKPDLDRNHNIYYELVFLITNLDTNDVTPGGPWNLKIDDIKLGGCNPIDTSPAPLAVNVDSTATFHVATSRADSADILTYQWMKDGAAIAGATNTVYTIASATLTDAGAYTVAVTVSGTGLTFTSQEAKLTVNASGTTAPQIITQPQSKTVTSGGSVTFTVTATGTPAPTYQWQKANSPITGATSATYTIPSVQSSDQGNYTVVVANSAGSVTSNAAALTVQPVEDEKKGCGCGSGTGLAFIPPLFFKVMANRKRKKKNLKTA
jgi:hypothetical protein